MGNKGGIERRKGRGGLKRKRFEERKKEGKGGVKGGEELEGRGREIGV